MEYDRAVLEYLRDVSLREPDVLRRLREATEHHPTSGWASPPEQTQLLVLLAQMTHAKCILEVGTFTGYSTLAFALSIPSDGKVVTLDAAEEYPAVGRPYWQEAGVVDRVELRLGDAKASLDALLQEVGPGAFDMAYIDCNKKDYDAYYERCLSLVKIGGVIALDNMLWGGRVLDRRATEKSTVALRALNEKLHADTRVAVSLLPIGDGLTLAWKRP